MDESQTEDVYRTRPLADPNATRPLSEGELQEPKPIIKQLPVRGPALDLYKGVAISMKTAELSTVTITDLPTKEPDNLQEPRIEVTYPKQDDEWAFLRIVQDVQGRKGFGLQGEELGKAIDESTQREKAGLIVKERQQENPQMFSKASTNGKDE